MSKFLTALIALIVSGCATQIGMRNTADQRLTMFSQIVFAPDYDSRRTEYLAKWTGPLRITLQDRDTYFVETYRSAIQTQLESIAKLTGLATKIVPESANPNITIFFDTLTGIKEYASTYARQKSAAANIDSAGCHSEIDRNARHEIQAARVFIRAERKVAGMLSTRNNAVDEANEANRLRIERCIALEMIRVVGLRNSSDIITPSIFNSTRNVDKTTVLDLKFIRTLYEPQLKAGMMRKTALQIADGFLQK